VEEILERQLLIGGRAFATFLTIEKALADRKKSFRGPYVVQACSKIMRSGAFAQATFLAFLLRGTSILCDGIQEC